MKHISTSIEWLQVFHSLFMSYYYIPTRASPRSTGITGSSCRCQNAVRRKGLAELWLTFPSDSSCWSNQEVVFTRQWSLAYVLQPFEEEIDPVPVLSPDYACIGWVYLVSLSAKFSATSIWGSIPQFNVCYWKSWNFYPNPDCAFQACKFQHICIYLLRTPLLHDSRYNPQRNIS